MKQFVIDRQKLTENITAIRARAGVPIIAVLDGDGCGMGMFRLATLLAAQGVEIFAVSDPADALRLRGRGFITQTILVLRSTAAAEDIEAIIEADAVATIGSLSAAQALTAVCAERGIAVQGHLLIQTGAGTSGFRPEEYESIKQVYLSTPDLEIVGMYTRTPGEKTPAKQAAVLTGLAERLKADQIEAGMLHAAEDAALHSPDKGVFLDAMRVSRAFGGRMEPLQTVGWLETEVIEVQELARGTAVAGVPLRQTVTAAVIPVGQTDGLLTGAEREGGKFLRAKKKSTPISIAEQPVSVLAVGDYDSVLDVTGMAVKVGDRVRIEVDPIHHNQRIEQYEL
ncbi:MAG: alanine racemase [Butyricicoccaceae bacterium]